VLHQGRNACRTWRVESTMTTPEEFEAFAREFHEVVQNLPVITPETVKEFTPVQIAWLLEQLELLMIMAEDVETRIRALIAQQEGQ
jgi:hypothetical protein